MATNSILDNLNSNDMISNIKLEIAADIKKEKVFLVVEGVDDKKFFKYLSKDNVIICESYSGKKGIEEILLYFKNNERIIGVRDRDYEIRKLDERIFFYDFCNVEMMIIHDNDIFEKICCEYYNGKDKYIRVRRKLLNNLVLISNLRKINETNKKMWNFQGINYNLILNNDCTINEEILYKEISRITGMNEKNINRNINLNENYTDEELLNITNGHDFIKIFSEYCKKNGTSNISEKNLSTGLRCGFVKSNFKKTNLYKNLKSYQKKNKIEIL